MYRLAWINNRRAPSDLESHTQTEQMWRARCTTCGYTSDLFARASAADSSLARHRLTKKHQEREVPKTLQQLLVRYDPTGFWMLVGCILLNRTQRSQGVDDVMLSLIERYHYADHMAAGQARYLERRIEPLGFQGTRARTLTRFAQGWGLGGYHQRQPTLAQLATFHGIGPYARDSWRIFMLGETDLSPRDRVLREHLGLPVPVAEVVQ